VAIVYGTDVQALADLPDPEVMCSEAAAAAYQCARRLLTASGALQDIGETQQYDSIDIREWLGARFGLSDSSVLTDLQAQATQVLLDDPFVQAVQVTVSYAGGTLTLSVQVQGTQGPFAFVIATNGVTTQLLLPGQT
jgi:hypothetical protein